MRNTSTLSLSTSTSVHSRLLLERNRDRQKARMSKAGAGGPLRPKQAVNLASGNKGNGNGVGGMEGGKVDGKRKSLEDKDNIERPNKLARYNGYGGLPEGSESRTTRMPTTSTTQGVRPQSHCHSHSHSRVVKTVVDTIDRLPQPQPPATPLRKADTARLAPTPARELLQAGYRAVQPSQGPNDAQNPEDKDDEEEEDDEDVPLDGFAARFVMKPPTPPRLKPRAAAMDVDSSTVAVIPSTPPAPVYATKSLPVIPVDGNDKLNDNDHDIEMQDQSTTTPTATPPMSRAQTGTNAPVNPSTPFRSSTLGLPTTPGLLLPPATPRTTLASPHRPLGGVSHFRRTGGGPPSSPYRAEVTGQIQVTPFDSVKGDMLTTGQSAPSTVPASEVEPPRLSTPAPTVQTESRLVARARERIGLSRAHSQKQLGKNIGPESGNALLSQASRANGLSRLAEDAAIEESTNRPLDRSVAPLPRPKASSSTSMGPPSRIPTKSSKPPLSGLPSRQTISDFGKLPAEDTNTAQKGQSRSTVKSLPLRRPSTRPTFESSSSVSSMSSKAASTATASTSNPPSQTVRRKPSYPSSLGSGPLMQPRSRLVSNPVLPPRAVSSPAPKTLAASTSASSSSFTTMDVDTAMDSLVRPQPRSVSDPVPGSRLSLSLSTRREGFGLDTSKSLVGLSEALEKLRMKKDEGKLPPRASISSLGRPRSTEVLLNTLDQVPSTLEASVIAPISDSASPSMTTSTSSRLSAVHRPRHSMACGDVSMLSTSDDGAADRSIAALMSSTSGSGSRCLKGVVAFVDVRTDEGGGAGDIWGEMLKGLGAKVGRHLPTCQFHAAHGGAPGGFTYRESAHR